jgi:putative transposase
MPRPPLPFRLRPRDRPELEGMVRSGVQQVRVVLRVLALLQLDAGVSAPRVGKVVGLTAEAVRRIGQRYQRGGVDRAVFEGRRPGAAEVLTASDKQRIIAMGCSAPPIGAARWTVRLIADEAVKRKLVPRVGRETVRILRQSHDLKPWRETNVVRGGADAGVHRQDGGRARAL